MSQDLKEIPIQFSSQTTKKYKVIESSYKESFEKEVEKHLKEGWTLAGGMNIVVRHYPEQAQQVQYQTVTFYQAVTLNRSRSACPEFVNFFL